MPPTPPTPTTPLTFDRHEPDFDVVHRLAPNLYSVVTRFLFQGQHPLHNRSLVVHAPAARAGERGTLAIINPVELTDGVAAGLRALEAELGAVVRHLISPGDWHYLFMGQHLAAFPEARAFVPPGRIPGKQPGFPFTLIDVAADNPFPELAPHVVTLVCQGLRAIDHPDPATPRWELAFYFPSVGAFTSGDVFYYNGGELRAAQKAIGQVAGVVDFHFFKWRMIRDRAAFQRTIERILAWNFDGYISIHGDPGNMRPAGARGDVERLLAWIQSPPADAPQ
jgi:hypothetical protein